MPHFIHRSNRVLLTIGLVLTGLVISDVHHRLLAARSPNASPAPTEHTVVFEQSAPAPVSGSTSHTQQPQQLAINTGMVNAASEPSVETVRPNEIAVNDWQGASFPVENFQAYTSPFGYRRSPTGGYSQEFHYGLDMAAPQGSYVRNWWGGTVVEVSDNSNCGTSVVIESGHWLHIYCHMQGYVDSDARGPYMIDREGGIQIWQGQEVQAGDRIGRVGMTGRTTGPHLHWGLKYDGNWVDPALVLRAMYEGQQNASRPNDASYQ